MRLRLIVTDVFVVTKAYAMSLRVTFLSCGILAVILCLLVLPVTIPDLPDADPRKASVSDDQEPGNDDDNA